MTGDKKTGPKPCLMGSSSPNPCPFPATEALPHRFPDRGPHLCVYHTATEPLVDEVDEFGVCLELLRAYLEDAVATAAWPRRSSRSWSGPKPASLSAGRPAGSASKTCRRRSTR